MSVVEEVLCKIRFIIPILEIP